MPVTNCRFHLVNDSKINMTLAEAKRNWSGFHVAHKSPLGVEPITAFGKVIKSTILKLGSGLRWSMRLEETFCKICNFYELKCDFAHVAAHKGKSPFRDQHHGQNFYPAALSEGTTAEHINHDGTGTWNTFSQVDGTSFQLFNTPGEPFQTIAAPRGISLNDGSPFYGPNWPQFRSLRPIGPGEQEPKNGRKSDDAEACGRRRFDRKVVEFGRLGPNWQTMLAKVLAADKVIIRMAHGNLDKTGKVAHWPGSSAHLPIRKERFHHQNNWELLFSNGKLPYFW